MKWSVIVTTAPRKEPTLQECVDSLRNCGWEPTILAEPDSPPSDALTIHNQKRLGVWHNWVKSVRIALETDADVILTVQDDSIFHPDCKHYIENSLWPATNCGFISLYTPRHYTIRKDGSLRPCGINRIKTRSLWGACALVWPRHVLEQVLSHPLTNSWYGASPKSKSPAVIERRKQNPETIANSDTAIGKLMNRMNKTMWFVDPSPVQHVAKYSSISHGGNGGNRNAHRIADHAIPLETQAPIPHKYESCS